MIKNIIYRFNVYFLISLITFLYTLYRSEITYNGGERDYYLVYYGLSLVLLIFSILNIFLRKEIKVYFNVSFISIILSLYIYEGYTTLKNKNSNSSYIEHFISLNDKNNYSLVFNPGWHSFSENFSIYPLSGISNKLTILPNENGYFPIYKSDKYGFNNSEFINKEIDFLFIGDSFVHGYSVQKKNNISNNFQRLSKSTNLNLGFGGSGPIRYLAILKEYMPKDVKNILYFYYEGNDHFETIKEYQNPFLVKYLNDGFSKNLINKQEDIDKILNKILSKYLIKYKEQLDLENKTYSKVVKFLKLNNFRVLVADFLPERHKPAIDQRKNYNFDYKLFEENLFEVLKQTKKFVTKNEKMNFYFIYLPDYFTVKNNNYKNKQNIIVRKITSDLKIKFIDMGNLLFEIDDDPLKYFPLRKYGHYNSKGYERIAEVLIKNIEN